MKLYWLIQVSIGNFQALYDWLNESCVIRSQSKDSKRYLSHQCGTIRLTRHPRVRIVPVLADPKEEHLGGAALVKIKRVLVRKMDGIGKQHRLKKISWKKRNRLVGIWWQFDNFLQQKLQFSAHSFIFSACYSVFITMAYRASCDRPRGKCVTRTDWPDWLIGCNNFHPWRKITWLIGIT